MLSSSLGCLLGSSADPRQSWGLVPSWIFFFLHQRGRAFACYELSLLFGVICGPTIGGFIVHTKFWTVAFWWTLAPLGAATITLFIFGEETKFERDSESPAARNIPPGFMRSRAALLFPGTQVTRPNRTVKMVGSAQSSWSQCDLTQ